MSASTKSLRQVNRSKSLSPEQSETNSSIDRQLSTSASLEQKLLNKLDNFLSNLETKLESFESYLTKNPDGSKVKDSLLFETLKSIKTQMARNHDRNLHPLGQILDKYYANEERESKGIQEDDNVTIKKIWDGLHILDERIEEFERTYDIMPKHPQERLRELKDTLYNYEKALVAGRTRLLNFYELPFQWRENKFIVFGYRFSTTHTHALKSICQGHNESANIWSHLLGAFGIIYLMFYHFPNTSVYAATSSTDHAIMYLFLIASLKCLLFSVIWHTYTNISTLYLRCTFACFDYTGITILIIASIITTEHIALYEYPWLRIGYITFSLISGIVGVVFAWSPYFDKPESRPIRIIFFLSLSALGIAAFFSAAYQTGFLRAWKLYLPLRKSFIWYLSGVVFYGSLIPERWRTDVIIDEFEISDETIMELDRSGKLEDYLNKTPTKTQHYGKFSSLGWVDYILNSHNIWHLFVLLGILGHYIAVLDMFKFALDIN